MTKRIVMVVVGLLLLAAVAWALWPQPVAVETETIGRRTITITVEDEGKSRVREVFSVSAPITGELLRVNLHAGDSVTAGTSVVASIRPVAPALLDARARRVATAAIDAASASVELAQAQQRQAEAQLKFLTTDLQRAETLVRRGAIPEKSYDKAVLDEAVARAELGRARANLAVQQQQLESARAALIETDTTGRDTCCVNVYAPVSGKVLRVATESEQVVQAGTPLVEIGDPLDIEISVDLLSRDAVRIRPGAEATIDGWGGAPLKARVQRIDPAAVTKVSALGIEEQRVNVILRLEDTPRGTERLGHGFRVVAHIVVWRGNDLLAVPVGALFRQGTDWATYVVKDNRASVRRLVLGEKNADHAVVSEGLQQGDVVILHPGDTVSDGVKVAPAAAMAQ